MKLLIVDSHPEDIVAVKRAVEHMPLALEVDAAETLQDGLKRFRSADIVLVDLDLPDSSDPRNCLLHFAGSGQGPIVICSAEDDPESMIASGYLGSHGYWLKGGNPDQLVHTLYHAVGAWHRQRERDAHAETLRQQLLSQMESRD